MRFDSFAPLLEAGYKDKVDIFRAGKVENPDGTTDIKYPDVPTQVGLKCKLSFAGNENPSNSAVDQNPLNLLPKIICSTALDILAGDYITGYRLDDDGNTLVTYSGYAGLPSVFKSHKEILMSVETSA